MKKSNPNRKEIFRKRISIFLKILIALLFLAIFPIGFGVFLTILSYRDFVFKSLLPDLPPEKIQEVLTLEQNIEVQAALILFLSGIFALFLGILISRHFSRALERISDGLKKVLVGNLDFEIKITSSDEIGEATYFFNRVIKSLKESKIMLDVRGKELQEKTLELAEKIRALEISGQETERARLATLNILEDVEEVRRELGQEKERIESIILSLVDGLIVLQDSRILLLNPSAKAILGVKEKEAIFQPLEALTQYSNLKILSHFLKENKKRPIFRQEIIFKEPERNFQITVISITQNQNLIVLHDVTREKLVEQMKTEFVSLAAHQLRTPLSAIKWTLRMILDGDVGRISKEQRDFLGKTYQSNERMIDLINDLLNVARIEEGKYLYQLLPSQIEDIIKNVISSYLSEIKRKKIKFQFQKLKENLPKLNLDEEKMTLAIQNFIDNAIRYTPPGGQVTVSLRRANMEIEFSVKDSGVGIPKDQQERVFSKFFRAANVMRMETEGTGLGLFITKNIIEAHGGKIWFESEENKGTTFYFTLPLKKT